MCRCLATLDAMRTPKGAIKALVALGLLLAVPSVSPATAALPVGSANGVRVHVERGAAVVVFTKRAAGLYRRVAGKWVSISCTEVQEERWVGVPLIGGGDGSTTSYRAPKRRRPLRTGERAGGVDYCRVSLAARTVRRGKTIRRQAQQLIASVPLTQTGAVYLDEQSKALDLWRLLAFAGSQARRQGMEAYPTPARLLTTLDVSRWRSGVTPVALTGPTETPPPGGIGYYSDGGEHAAVVVVSASGRRLFLERQPGGALHSNVAAYLYDFIHRGLQ
jgi:hypothetical protein